jgi:hypothetical protein
MYYRVLAAYLANGILRKLAPFLLVEMISVLLGHELRKHVVHSPRAY